MGRAGKTSIWTHRRFSKTYAVTDTERAPSYRQDLVFANEIGRPVEQGNLLCRSFWPLLSTAGLPRIRFHDLRHTAATLLLHQGVHPKVVSELLGHSSIGLTLGTYSHVLPDMQQQAVTAMDTLLTRSRRSALLSTLLSNGHFR